MKRFWKKENERHVQVGLEVGNDLTCVEEGEWGTYCPLTDAEHRARGYIEISRDEAEEMAAIAGHEIH